MMPSFPFDLEEIIKIFIDVSCYILKEMVLFSTNIEDKYHRHYYNIKDKWLPLPALEMKQSVVYLHLRLSSFLS